MTRARLAVVFAGLRELPHHEPAVRCLAQGGHRHTATCVECHLPHAGIAKWVAKADHGVRHSAAFTLQNFKEPIEITPRDRDIVRANSLRCHEALVEAVAGGPAGKGLDCLLSS